jgi:hypothetical protein
MPKPSLVDEDSRLEGDLIETLLAGLKEWRPDLQYPESHSDMSGCVRAMMRMYDIKRRPIAVPLRLKCGYCDGAGEFTTETAANTFSKKDCPRCEGNGFIEG